jgi:hypothetical protein
MNTTAATIEAVAAELGLSMKAEFVPWHQSRNSQERHRSLNWKVTLAKHGRDFLTTDYSAGEGHCPSYKQGDNTVDRVHAVRLECQTGLPSYFINSGVFTKRGGKPIMPKFADVLYSLASDSDVLDAGGFESWAENYGYDSDSREAEAVYNACVKIALKLRGAIGEDGLRKLREACQDY